MYTKHDTDFCYDFNNNFNRPRVDIDTSERDAVLKEYADFDFGEFVDMEANDPVFVSYKEMDVPVTPTVIEVRQYSSPVHTASVFYPLSTIGIVPAFGSVQQSSMNFIRDFAPLSQVPMIFEGELIAGWDIPDLGADTLMLSHLSTVQINGPNSLIHGSGQSSMAISACREKLDGIETAQIVAITASGRRVAFLWNSNEIRLVDAQKSAHYEYIGPRDGSGVYYLLSGQKAFDIDCRPHMWEIVSSERLSSFQKDDGAMLLCNGVEMRLKNKRTISVRKVGSIIADTGNNRYSVEGIAPGLSDGIIEVEWLSLGKCRFIKSRSDRDFADSKGVIASVISSATIQDLIRLIPQVSRSGPVVTTLSYVSSASVEAHRVVHRTRTDITPYSWSRVASREDMVEYVQQLLPTIARSNGVLCWGDAHAWALANHSYISGGRLLKVEIKFPVSNVINIINIDQIKYVITPVPLATTSRIIVASRNSTMTPKLIAGISNCYHAGDINAYVIYLSPYKTNTLLLAQFSSRYFVQEYG